MGTKTRRSLHDADQGERGTLEQENAMVGDSYGMGISDRTGGRGYMARGGLARQHHQLIAFTIFGCKTEID